MSRHASPTRPHGRPFDSDAHVRVRLDDGGTALLRPLLPGELDVLERVFDGLSARSRRQRYLVPMPRLPGSARRALADLDDRDHVAWAAQVGDAPVGICRYVRTGPGSAEVAFEVVDTEQGRGIGAALVDALSTVAVASGVSSWEATVEPDNHASVVLLARVGVRLEPRDGLLEGRGRLHLLEPPRVDRAAVLALVDQAMSGAASSGARATQASTTRSL